MILMGKDSCVDPWNMAFKPVPWDLFIKVMYLGIDAVIIKHALLNLCKNKDDQLVPEHQGGIKVVTTTISYCHYKLLPL